ncbi:hypothetical protein VNO77_31033 [Canavalia gladiata]|uniref:Uncharacterized protein n=1 Tax=Canavalia gladiata TaxID=3824 RepID=A0AAN9KRM6_CANGL
MCATTISWRCLWEFMDLPGISSKKEVFFEYLWFVTSFGQRGILERSFRFCVSPFFLETLCPLAYKSLLSLFSSCSFAFFRMKLLLVNLIFFHDFQKQSLDHVGSPLPVA